MQTPKEDEPVTLKWYVNFSWFNQEWGKDAVSKKIMEETGINVEFVTPLGNENETLDTLVSSNELPDLLTMGWWESHIATLVNDNQIYALNELADLYEPLFWHNVDSEVKNWHTSEDGNLYYYPNSFYTYEQSLTSDHYSSTQTFLVRKDIYEAIGSPDMTTQQGFVNALKKAQEMFPEVNGRPLIPLGLHEFTDYGNDSLDLQLMNLLAVPYEVNGQYNDRYSNEDYLSWLKVLRQLYQDGLILDEVFVDKRLQMQEKIGAGQYFAMIYQRTDLTEQQITLYNENPDAIYIAVDGPKNHTGDDHTLTASGIQGWTVSMISKDSKHPKEAMKLLTFLMSEEGQKLTYAGVEGVEYEQVDNTIVYNKEALDIAQNDYERYKYEYGGNNVYWMMQNMMLQEQWPSREPAYLQQMAQWSSQYTIYSSQYDVFLPYGSDLSINESKIELLWGITLPQLIRAESDATFDALFLSFLEQRQALDFDGIQVYKTQMMHEYKERLGVE